jgi:hypothetical protein
MATVAFIIAGVLAAACERQLSVSLELPVTAAAADAHQAGLT